jgi:hypothetical protein
VANNPRDPLSLLNNKFVVHCNDDERWDSNVKFMDVGNVKAAAKMLFDRSAATINNADNEEDKPVLKFSNDEDESILIGYRGTKFFRVDYK